MGWVRKGRKKENGEGGGNDAGMSLVRFEFITTPPPQPSFKFPIYFCKTQQKLVLFSLVCVHISIYLSIYLSVHSLISIIIT